MDRKFGNCWDMFGTLEKTSVVVIVGAIDEKKSEEVGLTTMQMRNLGTDYGPCQVISDKGLIQVPFYDGSLLHGFIDNKVAVSKGLAERLFLNVGQQFRLERVIDRAGRIRHECKTDKSNPFGHIREELRQPIEAIIAAIDNYGANTQLYRIGLSSFQLRNLGFQGKGPRDTKAAKKLLDRRKRGFLDGLDYGDVIVSCGEKYQTANVYNASGSHGFDGPAIRVSSKLANSIGLELEDKVLLEKTD